LLHPNKHFGIFIIGVFNNQRATVSSEQTDDLNYFDRLRRRLYLSEKVAINTAICKGLLSEDIGQTYLKALNEKLL